MDDWRLTALGSGVGGLEAALLGVPLLVALLLALFARAPRNTAEFEGREGELSPWSVGFSLGMSDLAGALALIALPLVAAGPRGGLVCLQGILIGGFLGRWIVSRWVLPACFAARERRPTAWIEERLGRGPARLAEGAFAFGAVASASARVFLFAFALHLALAPSLTLRLGKQEADGSLLILIIAVVWLLAALPLLLRGVRGAVAGDGVLLVVTLAAAAAGLVGLVGLLANGWGLFVNVLLGSHKHEPLSFLTHPGVPDTFWVALLVSSVASAAHYGTDPVQLTRLLATGSLPRARRALWVSFAGALPALFLVLIGAGLFAWDERNLLSGTAASLIGERPAARWPVFVAEELPAWAKGLVLAGFAASAVAGARAVLAALTPLLNGWWRSWRGKETGLGATRLLALGLALLLCAATLACAPLGFRVEGLLDFALSANLWTFGPLLAVAGLALLPRPPAASGVAWAVPLALVGSFALVWHTPRSASVCSVFAVGFFLAWFGWRFLPDWFGYGRRGGALLELLALAAALQLVLWVNRHGYAPLERDFRFDPEWIWLPLSPPWYVPAGGWIGFVFGCLLARGSASSEGLARHVVR